jgi:sarcosine oxidase subunit beta
VILLERSRIGRHASGASAAGVRTLSRAREELPAALVAQNMWHDMESLVGDDCGFHSDGQIEVAETEEELDRLRARVNQLRQDGFTHEEIIDAAEVRRLVPALKPVYVGAAIARRDGAADPHQTLKAFLRAAQEAGVVVREGVGVDSLESRDGVWRLRARGVAYEAPLLVNAAGAWAGQIAGMAGDFLPLSTKASMMIVTERVAPFVKPTVISMRRKLSFKQTNQGTLLIGGGQPGRVDLAAERGDVDVRYLAKSAVAATSLFPQIGNLRIVRSWAGLEAKTSDDVAVAGLSPAHTSLMHLCGFCGHGFQLVPALGIAAADLLLDGHTNIDITQLNPARLISGYKGKGKAQTNLSQSEITGNEY